MKRYTYEVMKLDGTFTDKTPLEDLQNALNVNGEEGFRLHSIIPQVYEGSTEANILIFEQVEEIEED